MYDRKTNALCVMPIFSHPYLAIDDRLVPIRERCYVTPMHCSHKIIKVLIITRLPQNITCLCNITRNAKFGKFILGIVLKYTAQKVYISVYFLKWNNINWILNMIGYTRWWLESTIQTIALFRITFWLFRERNVWSLS